MSDSHNGGDDSSLTAGVDNPAQSSYETNGNDEDLYADSHESREYDERREQRDHNDSQQHNSNNSNSNNNNALLPDPSHSSSSSYDNHNNNHQSNSSSEGDQRKVYVENLPLPMNDDKLREWFSPFGAIERVHIGSKDGKQLGFAFVEYENDKSGADAIANMHQKNIAGRAIRVSVAKQKSRNNGGGGGGGHSDRNNSQQHQSSQNSSLAQQQQQQQQQQAMMMQMGMQMPMMMMGPNGQMMMAPMPNGMMMPNMMPNMMPMQAPMTQMTPSTSSSSSSGKDQPQPNQNLFINGIPFSWTDQELESLFQPFGTITRTKILKDMATGQSKGQGFVHYELFESAVAAMAAWHGKKPPGSDTFLQVRYAYRKDGTTNPNSNHNNSQQQQQMQPMLQMPMLDGMGQQTMMPMMPMAYQPSTSSSHDRPSSHDESSSSYGPDRKTRTSTAARHNPLARPPVNTSIMNGASTTTGYQPTLPSETMQDSSDVCLFVFHVPRSANQEEFQKLFGLYGQVVDVSIPLDRNKNNEPRGYAFVVMKELKAAENAMQNLNGYQMDGKRLKVSFKNDAKNLAAGRVTPKSSSSSSSSQQQPQQSMLQSPSSAAMQQQQQQMQQAYGMQMPMMMNGGMNPMMQGAANGGMMMPNMMPMQMQPMMQQPNQAQQMTPMMHPQMMQPGMQPMQMMGQMPQMANSMQMGQMPQMQQMQPMMMQPQGQMQPMQNMQMMPPQQWA